MASANYGFSAVNNNLNSKTAGAINNLNLQPEDKNYTAVRVVDIILDDANKEKFNEVGGWTGLGAIYYVPVDSPSSIPKIAYSNYVGFKNYPLIGEIVYIISLPGNLNFNKDNERVYYIGGVNIWNHPHHNATPNDPNLTPSTQNKSLQETELGNTNVVSSNPVEINLGKTFSEKADIHPIRPFEGDVIVESRFGSSIRFGSTVRSKILEQISLDEASARFNLSRLIAPNDWSDDETSRNGDPILIIRNGQGYPIVDPDDPRIDISKEAIIPIVEDINKDESSIYLSSTQKINIQTATQWYDSYNGSEHGPPEYADRYAGNQIILNSGRLVFNSKFDHILLSSAKSINLGAIESVNIDTRKFVVAADEVFLGTEENIKQSGYEPLLLGLTTKKILFNLMGEIQNLANALSQLQSSPAVVGSPTIFPNLYGPAKMVSSQLDLLRNQLDDITSKQNYTL